MSGGNTANYDAIIKQLGLVRLVADPNSITVSAAYHPPASNERPTIVANSLGIPLANIQHVHDENPMVYLDNLT
jgi:hypothetical protein